MSTNWIIPLVGLGQTPFCDKECTMFSMLEHNGSPTNPVYGRGGHKFLSCNQSLFYNPSFPLPHYAIFGWPIVEPWTHKDSRDGFVIIVCQYLGQNNGMDGRVQQQGQKMGKKVFAGVFVYCSPRCYCLGLRNVQFC